MKAPFLSVLRTLRKRSPLVLRILLASGGLVLLLILLADWFYPVPKEVLSPPPLTTQLLDRSGRLIAEIPTAGAREAMHLTLRELGPFLPAATIALEDRRFHAHTGVDVRAVLRAIKSSFLGSREGGSTITQQYVKLTRARSGPPLLDKIMESLHARKLERIWSKNRILEAYLNRLDYGNRLIGPQAAALSYFGKRPVHLTEAEAVFLAALPRAPTAYNPWRYPETARARFEIAARVAAPGSALRPPAVQPPRETVTQAPFFVRHIRAQLGSRTGGIPTTLDLTLQREVEQFLDLHLRRLNRYDVTACAAIVVSNATASVRALASIDRINPEIDGTQIRRSPGSTLKPFVYGLGLDQRSFTSATLLPDTEEALRTVYPDYNPRNFDDRHFGPVRVREALASSLNIPAVVALQLTGARTTYHRLERFGFRWTRDFHAVGAGFVLGNAEVTLRELAEAYTTLARQGHARSLRFLADEHSPSRSALSPGAAAIISDILADQEARRRTFGRSSALDTSVRTAVKTGTSSGFRDAWAAGYTSRHTVVVWAGNSSGTPMRELPAIQAAAPLWRMIMEHLIKQGDPGLLPSMPASLQEVEICALTGLLPSSLSPARLTEYFLPDTLPTEVSENSLQEQNGRVVPLLDVSYREWVASSENLLGALLNETTKAEPQILYPRRNQVVSVDPVLPRSQQEMELVASGEAPYSWRVSGEVVPDVGGRFFWPIRPGKWEAELTTPQGVVKHPFTVLSPEDMEL